MIKFICQKCGKQTQDTVGGVLHDGFLLECSECFEITVVRFGDYSVEHRLHLTAPSVRSKNRHPLPCANPQGAAGKA